MMMKSTQGSDVLPLRTVLLGRAVTEMPAMLAELIVQLAESRKLTKTGIELLCGHFWEINRTDDTDKHYRVMSADSLEALLCSVADDVAQHPNLVLRFFEGCRYDRLF